MDPPDHEVADHDPASAGAPQPLVAVAPGVLLWCASLERSPEEIGRVAGWLSPAETARAARFGCELLRRRWIAGRTTLRLLLGRTLGVGPAEVALQRGRRGRPELADAAARIDFNVSHTGAMALFAIGHELPAGTRIGVDIERSDRDVGADRLARKFLTAGERATLTGLDAAARRQRFLRYWTCKEAMSKATADGLAAPFSRLEVELAEPPRLAAGPAPYSPQDWSLHAAAVPAGWYATVAVWRDPASSH